MNKLDFSHVLELPVRWGDADVYGHINNVSFVRYVESGRVAYVDDVMKLSLTANMDAAWVLADIQCSFLQQVEYPTLLEICTRVKKLGTKSITLETGLYRQGESEPVLTSVAVMVWFDFKAQKAAAIPVDQRETMKAYEKSLEEK